MASTSIPPIDITGSKSELSERWPVWLRGFTYFAEGKANLRNAARKKSKLLYRAGSGVHFRESFLLVKAKRVMTFISKSFEY